MNECEKCKALDINKFCTEDEYEGRFEHYELLNGDVLSIPALFSIEDCIELKRHMLNRTIKDIDDCIKSYGKNDFVQERLKKQRDSILNKILIFSQ